MSPGDFQRGAQQLLEHPNFTLVEHDVCSPLKGDFEEIYNLACPASPIHYQRDPVMTVRTNVLGALHALDLAKECGAKIFQASTSEVYGDPKEHPQKESYSTWARTRLPFYNTGWWVNYLRISKNNR